MVVLILLQIRHDYKHSLLLLTIFFFFLPLSLAWLKINKITKILVPYMPQQYAYCVQIYYKLGVSVGGFLCLSDDWWGPRTVFCAQVMIGGDLELLEVTTPILFFSIINIFFCREKKFPFTHRKKMDKVRCGCHPWLVACK